MRGKVNCGKNDPSLRNGFAGILAVETEWVGWKSRFLGEFLEGSGDRPGSF